MKVLLQRVKRGSVTIDTKITGEISAGLVALVGVRHGDTEKDVHALAEKTLKLRVFPDEHGRMNRSVSDIEGSILVISQFTLYADTRKGLRPSFTNAAEPEWAKTCYLSYIEHLKTALGPARVQTGQFGADMCVEIINDGPVTIELCSDPNSAN